MSRIHLSLSLSASAQLLSQRAHTSLSLSLSPLSLSLSLSASAQFPFHVAHTPLSLRLLSFPSMSRTHLSLCFCSVTLPARAHTSLSLSLCVCSVSLPCRAHTSLSLSLSLSASAQFPFHVAHTPLSLCFCSVALPARAHTSLSFSLSASAQFLFSDRQRGAALNSVKHRYYVASLIYMQVKPKSQHSYGLYLMCIWFHQTTVRLSWFFCADEHLGREIWLCSLNGSRFSHYFIFIPLSDNRNSKIYQWKQFYWEFSFIKIQYVGTERETNVIINVHFAFSEEVSCPVCKKCKQVCK